jgi:hypothetical protein
VKTSRLPRFIWTLLTAVVLTLSGTTASGIVTANPASAWTPPEVTLTGGACNGAVRGPTNVKVKNTETGFPGTMAYLSAKVMPAYELTLDKWVLPNPGVANGTIVVPANYVGDVTVEVTVTWKDVKGKVIDEGSGNSVIHVIKCVPPVTTTTTTAPLPSHSEGISCNGFSIVLRYPATGNHLLVHINGVVKDDKDFGGNLTVFYPVTFGDVVHVVVTSSAPTGSFTWAPAYPCGPRVTTTTVPPTTAPPTTVNPTTTTTWPTTSTTKATTTTVNNPTTTTTAPVTTTTTPPTTQQPTTTTTEVAPVVPTTPSTPVKPNPVVNELPVTGSPIVLPLTIFAGLLLIVGIVFVVASERSLKAA